MTRETLIDESQRDVTDEDWEEVTSPSSVGSARAKGEEELSDLTNDQVQHLRKRAKNDLFFLAYGLLEYDLLSTNLHGHLCQWLRATRDQQYRMILLPRGHYKSTLVTISDAIQMALPNDAGVQAHPYSLGPNIKMLLAHENRESASRFLFEITEAFMKKPMMVGLFPECVPSRSDHRINKWELELPRGKHHKEPTFDTIGAGGASQGRHYNWIKLDDIIGKKARDSDTVMGRTIDWFDNVNSLLTRAKIDGWDLVGTRWSHGDIYSRALDVYGVDFDRSINTAMEPADLEPGKLAVYVRSAIEQGEPIFPEEFSLDFFEDIRNNPRVWAAQYANNPKESGLLEFQRNWLNFYNVAGQSHLVVFEGDRSRSVQVNNLDRVVLVDPSMGENAQSDPSGICVTGTDDDLNIYLLETVKKRLRPPDLIAELIRLYQKWNPRLISIEEVAFSATYRYWLKDEFQELGINPNLHKYKPGSKKAKKERIRGLSNYFAAGQFYLLEGMHDFLTEYERFPMTDSEHLLDALAQGPEVWDEGLSQERWDEFRRAEQKILDRRSPVTGY